MEEKHATIYIKQENVITVISGLLIVLGFFSHFVLENVGLSEWSLIIASVFGITPIAIQAFQAMKVKVISIDVLVSIAAIGALLFKIMKNRLLSRSYSYSDTTWNNEH